MIRSAINASKRFPRVKLLLFGFRHQLQEAPWFLSSYLHGADAVRAILGWDSIVFFNSKCHFRAMTEVGRVLQVISWNALIHDPTAFFSRRMPRTAIKQ
ncbi:hypothetical protein PM082_023513 [Marasmius tenuissimus]|nr:hypothetical protein PM082_023513 [Marasmius tenuissimus]